jgi:hypothetical protein
MAVLTPASVFRQFVTDGVPASGKHKPLKAEIIQLLNTLFGTSRGGWVVASTLAELEGITPEDETDGGVVLTGAGAGYYDRDSAAWVFGRGFPDTFARVTLGGTANAQTGTVSAGVNPANIEVFIAFVTTPNTGSMTLSVDGETARDVVNVAGNSLSAGEWTGVVLFVLNDDGDYQLIVDAGAAASAAQSASEAGGYVASVNADANRAEEAANVATGVLTTVLDPQFPTLAAAEVFAPVAAPDYIRTAGHTVAGDGGGALYKKIASEPSHAGKFSITLDDGSTVVWYELAPDSCVYPEQFGAVPAADGDSTNAFTALDGFLAAYGKALDVILPDVYKVNPLNTVVPLGTSQARLLTLHIDGSTIGGPGGVIIDDAPDYTAGYSAGDEKYWTAFQINADNCRISGTSFDGNGKGTATGYNPAVVNIRFQHASSFGTALAHRRGNIVSNNHGSGYGGQSVAFQYQDDAKILFNNFDGHSGMGVSAGQNAVVFGNTSRDCYDAPVYVNGVFGAQVTLNNLIGTSNGSGIDIVGSDDVIASGNYVEDAQGAGIWIHRSTQASRQCQRVRVSENTLKANARFTGSALVGEITVGDSYDTEFSATDVLIYDNTIIMDGSLGDFSGRPLVTNYGVTRLEFSGNRISGTPNVSNRITAIQRDVNGLVFRSNKCIGFAAHQEFYASESMPYSFAQNEGVVVASSSVPPISAVVADDGSLVFSARKTISTGGITTASIVFLSSSWTRLAVEVEVLQDDEFRGGRKRRYIIRGKAGSTTVVENASDVYSYGANPPTPIANNSSGAFSVSVSSVGASAVSDLNVRVSGNRSQISTSF